MKFERLLTSFLSFFTVFAQKQWPISNTGYTDVIEWDHYSLIVKGQRLVVWSGEFHYWRMPVPELWQDLLEKIKAHGFNTVSVYGHWGYHSASEDALDFETITHDPRPILDYSKKIGLYVIWRPGPYVNAESHAGGHAQWATTGAYGSLRNNDTRFTKAYTPYMTTYEKLLKPYQVQFGGNLIAFQIENEFSPQRLGDNSKNAPPNWLYINYMQTLIDQARENGIGVPLTHNNPSTQSKDWSKDFDPRGAVDISGFDTYPYCWSCLLSVCGGRYEYDVQPYYGWFEEISPNQPPYIPEFQGGSYNPWGGPAGGCIQKQNSEFVNIMYKHNIGERITMISIYVFFGGTNWGNIGFPESQTSYDYAAAISETRVIGEKFWEGKTLGLLIDVARDLAKTDRVYVGTNLTTSTNVYTSLLENPDTHSRFYVLRHTVSNSTTLDDFKVTMATSEGTMTVPKYGSASLHGLASKIFLSDFKFAEGLTLLYTTAEVLTVSTVDKEPVLVLWVPNGEAAEFSVKGYKANEKKDTVRLCKGCEINYHGESGDNLVVNFKQEAGISIVQFDGFRVVMIDRGVAWRTWAPKLSNDPLAGSDQNIIVHGLHLVRKVSISGGELQLFGDTDSETTMTIHAPAKIRDVSWNGKKISRVNRRDGVLEVELQGPKISERDVLSQLNSGKWKAKNTLPEISPDYDDSAWIVANDTTTPNPIQPATPQVLYAENYGFFHGYVLFRGRFNGGNSTTGVFMNLQFGAAGGYSAWLNGQWIGSWTGTTATRGNSTFEFPKGSVKTNGENVLVILMDHNGKDQYAEALNYRGIYQITLIGAKSPDFTKWTIQGNAGGTKNIDPVRGPYNEGGLYAERLGWHLNGFNPKGWSDASKLSVANATAVFFRKEVDFSVPAGYDIPLYIRLGSPSGQKLRVQIYVNGYQFGKYIPQVGSQVDFPIPPGVLNYNGKNVFGVSVWNVQDGTEVTLDYEWKVAALYESSFSDRFDVKKLQPGYDPSREKYA
ncbi:putative beta galactosidase [Choiromyces venosus 120613-1]|uniref:beta-galactosidase n=1 Tax=Choiromyces venosus 120613-1 TaxID=1336337 RepID=A0A3N4K0Y6_9PEZI|nr:putative beta galactosidase [Choiromyces venosus 120613-1]